ncbi:MAG: hypothetical protein ABJ308_11165 [Halieaceae bacterium]
MSETSDLQITASKTGFFLLWVALCLTAAHVLAVVIWYEDLLPIDDWLYISFFDLDEEESLGTWFSALILLFAGQLSLLQARYVRTEAQGKYLWWLLLAIGFHLLSLDEVAGFHEFVNTVVDGTHWTTFGAVIVLVVGVSYLPFLWALPTRTRCLFLLSGLIYVGGAVGVEWGTIWHEENDLLDTLEYNLWNAVEEFLEMAGVILFIYTLLDHIAAHGRTAGLKISFAR